MKLSHETYNQPVARIEAASSDKPIMIDSAPIELQQRLNYLDWLRVLAVLGVFYAHSISIFNTLFLRLSDSRQQALVVFGTEWGMALFFLLAGASVRFSLASRTSRQFIGERFARLIIPFVVGVVLLSPLQAYLLDASLSHNDGSLLQYYPYFFLHIQFSWDPQLLAAYGFHLWFLAFLFLFSVIAVAPFTYLKSATGKWFIGRLAVVFERRGGIYLFLIPLALIQLALRAAFPDYQGWTDFLSWFVYFVYGYVLLTDIRLTKAILKQGMLALTVGIASFATLLVMMYGPGYFNFWDGTPGYTVKFELYQLLLTIIAWSWMLFVLYFGMRLLDRSNKVIQYANEAVLPFYVLHYFVIVVITYFAVPWNIALVAKFVIVSSLALAVTLGIYELLIRRVALARRIFGMKTRSRESRL